jgi:hypothetical protein
MIPKGVDPDSVTSDITSDGILTVIAPKSPMDEGNHLL